MEWLLFVAQLATVLVVLAVAYRPLGDYMAATFTGTRELRGGSRRPRNNPS